VDGSIWVGYRDAFGISRLSFPKNRTAGKPEVTHYSAGAGLHSDKTLFLGFDADGRLWVGTDHGVDVFDHVGWRHYGRSEGLIWDDCNTNAFLADASGVWIGAAADYPLSAFDGSAAECATVVYTSVKLATPAANPRACEILP
jgi:ligand-binding sensor domain-containing protein